MLVAGTYSRQQMVCYIGRERKLLHFNIFSFAFPVTMMAVFFIIYLSVSTLGISLSDLANNAIMSMQETMESMVNG